MGLSINTLSLASHSLSALCVVLGECAGEGVEVMVKVVTDPALGELEPEREELGTGPEDVRVAIGVGREGGKKGDY